jgi:hypothetical protein
MRQPPGVTNACMTRSQTVVGDGNIHKLIHVLQDQHVAVQHGDPLELVQPINMDFGPGLIESRFRHRVRRCRIKPRDVKSGNRALSKDLQRTLTQRLRFRIFPKSRRVYVRVDNVKGILCPRLDKAVMQRQNTAEIGFVGEQTCPDLGLPWIVCRVHGGKDAASVSKVGKKGQNVAIQIFPAPSGSWNKSVDQIGGRSLDRSHAAAQGTRFSEPNFFVRFPGSRIPSTST